MHIPVQFKNYRFFDIGTDHYYYDDFQNKYRMRRIADYSLLPANKMMLKLIKEHDIRISYTISGITLRLLEWYTPEVLESFKALSDTGNVEFLATPFFHSIASLRDKEDFEEQVKMHVAKIEELFSQTPKSFSNTDLIYSDSIGEHIAEMGFSSVLTEGAKHILGWKSPDFVYTTPHKTNLAVLMRNCKLSDDISFRFSEYQLTADTYAQWLQANDPKSPCVNISLDYRVLGDIQREETGIFSFFEQLPKSIKKYTDFEFRTPSELVKQIEPSGIMYIPSPITWLGQEKDMSAILGNELQNDAIQKIYDLKEAVLRSGDQDILRIWRVLQDSVFFLQMNKKSLGYTAGNTFKDCPYQNYINFMNILADMALVSKSK